MKKVNCITINTDASFCPQTKVSSYAFYIICDYFKIQKGGIFKAAAKSPLEAEMMCMANALHCLLKQNDLPSASLIVINSDCLFSFEKIGLKKTGIGKKVALLLREARIKTSYKGLIKPKFEFRHVKAHSNIDNPRSHVNKWCDAEAKRWLQIARVRCS